jgi:uncharacterized membrane protein
MPGTTVRNRTAGKNHLRTRKDFQDTRVLLGQADRGDLPEPGSAANVSDVSSFEDPIDERSPRAIEASRWRVKQLGGPEMMKSTVRSLLRCVPVVLAAGFAISALGGGPGGNGYTFFPIEDPAGSTSVFGINSAGVMSGNYGDPSGEIFGFVLSQGNFTNINVPGSSFTELAHINSRGTAVGDYIDASGNDLGFTYSVDGTFTYLPAAAPGAATIPIGINDAGAVTGLYSSDGFTTAHGFIYDKGTLTYFDAPGSTFTVPWAVTNSGTVGGWFTDASGTTHGFLRDSTGAITQFDLPGADNTSVYGLNENGDIVGSYGDGTKRHGYLFRKGVITTLDYPGDTNTDAFGINEQGTIVGTYDDFSRGFLATPSR